MTRRVLAGLLVVAGLAVGCGEQAGTEVAGPEPSEPRSGWRFESWADLSFQVPVGWRHGSPDQWCIDGGTKDPAVLKPDAVSTLALCTHPFQTYGVRVLARDELTPDVADPDRTAAQAMGKYGDGVPGRAYPEGAQVRVAEAGDWALVVVAPDATTADAITSSAVVADTDPLGCGAAAQVPERLGGEPVVADLEAGAPAVLCHYTGRGVLRGSELLEGDDSRALVEALQGTEVDPAAAGDCSAETEVLRGVEVEPAAWTLVRVGAHVVHAALEPHGCLGIGITDGPEARRFTEDALYWLITPGVGSQWSPSELVPMPRERRG